MYEIDSLSMNPSPHFLFAITSRIIPRPQMQARSEHYNHRNCPREFNLEPGSCNPNKQGLKVRDWGLNDGLVTNAVDTRLP